MAYVDSDGWQVWYEVTGSGPPLVCSGGMIMMHDQFARVREALAKHFTVIDWNHRGAGQSERTSVGGFTFADFMRDLQRVLEAAKVKRAHHWGCSTGSLMAIRHAARQADAVDRLVLWPTWQTGAYDANNAYAQIARTTGMDGVIWNAYWVATSQEAIDSGEVLKLALEEMAVARRNMPPPVYARVIRGLADVDLTADVRALRQPVLLLAGGSGRNGASSPGVAAKIREFRELVPGAELAVIPKAGGTLPMIEQPEATIEALVRFLKG